MKKIKVGVIGTGFIGPVHIEGLQRNPGLVTVEAVVGHSFEKARAAAEQFGIPKAFGDYRELLADSSIDAVHICSPNHLHFSMVKDALEAGKHVVCEKPLAITHKEGQELLFLAKKKKLAHGVHFNLRYYPLVQNLRVKILRGEMGGITAVHGGFLQDWLLYPTDYNWRLESEKAGEARVIGDIGSHWLDLMEFLTGQKIERLCADFSTIHTTRRKPENPTQTFTRAAEETTDRNEYTVDTEDMATLIFQMSGGIRGSAVFSQVAPGRKCFLNFEINGRKESASWNSEKPNHMWFGNRDSYNRIQVKDPASMEEGAARFVSYPGGHQEGFGDTVKQYVREFYTAIAEGADSDVPGFDAGLREIIICDCILKSVREGRWIDVKTPEEGGKE